MEFWSRLLCVISLIMSPVMVMAQQGLLKGRVFNEANNEPLPFANIVLDSSLVGAVSDIDGQYKIEGIVPGTHNLFCSSMGYNSVTKFEIIISTIKPTQVDFALSAAAYGLDLVEIKANPFTKREESPVSMQTIGASEIYRNPGGNRDISKVIQILPGVATTSSFRNDLIVRGGAPNENRFYLDGIEIPNINHFATQGSSGGPVGMINVNFVNEVDFYAGAFPANRGNALSSVLEFKQREGNNEKLNGNLMVGSSDLGITLEGPMGKKSSFLFSARRSYLQFLFKALGLPFLPTYNDFQWKQNIQINKKNKVTILGLGAIDDFEINSGINDSETDPDKIEQNNYTLGNLATNTQWNYAVGANWTHYSTNSFQNFVISRNHLNNNSVKYSDNIDLPENLILNYSSQEIENKFRFEHTVRKNKWKWNVGTRVEHVEYSNDTYNKREVSGAVEEIEFSSELTFLKYAVFTQVSMRTAESRLLLSGGIRTDFNGYSANMINPLTQLSPRFSTSYSLTDKIDIGINIGRYYQLPAYTVMGYKDADGLLVNRQNNLKYIAADHLVGGLTFAPSTYSKLSLEGFYKRYSNYPFLVVDSISLANLGGEFGVIGNEEVTSTSTGRSYGLEFLAQQKLSSSIYGILSYTYVVAEFKNSLNVYKPSAWDNGHILNITAGKKFKRNYEVGLKFRLQGGAPYTPYDKTKSSTKSIWDVTKQGILDYDKLNEQRSPVSHGLDIRIDKKWYFEKAALNVYIDIQNVYGYKTEGRPYLDVVRSSSGDPVEDPLNSSAYLTKEIKNSSGTILPSIGLMFEF